MGTYLPNRVHAPLAAIVGDYSGITTIHYDRFSVEDDGGIESQVSRHCALYPGDADVAAYRAMPSEAFVDARVGRVHGAQPLAACDIHPSLPTRRIGSLTRIGATLFVRLELSATEMSIQTNEGEANPYTLLIIQLTNYCVSATISRWAADPSRASRLNVNWALIMERHQARNVRMSLAGSVYDLSDKGDRVALKVLGAVASEDDPDRRRKLVESRLDKMLAGGATLSEDQMPYGWTIEKDARGRPAKDAAKGLVPVAEASLLKVLPDVYRAYAEGETHAAIVQLLVAAEKEGLIRRRAGQRYAERLTFSDALAAGNTAVYDATSSVFCSRVARTSGRASRRAQIEGPTAPSEEAIQAYLDGGDPSRLFTLPQRMLIARIELLRTGRFLRVLRSDIRQRGLVLCGIPARYTSDEDEYGYFVVEATWPWPVDPATGRVVPRFGIDDGILRRCAARLLRSLHPSPNRGRRKATATIHRAIGGFDSWWSEDRLTQWNVIGRQNNNGAPNLILLSRPEAESTVIRSGQRMPVGWGTQLSSPETYVRATLRLSDLCRDVARAVVNTVTEEIDAQAERAGSRLRAMPAASSVQSQRARLLARADRADHNAQELIKDATGQERLAGRALNRNDEEAADRYEAAAAELRSQAAAQADKARALHSQAAELTEVDPRDDLEVDVSLVAYLAVALERAVETRGWASERVAAVADRLLTGWRMWTEDAADGAGGGWVGWAVTLLIPLADGGTVELPLTGHVRNVRPDDKTMGKDAPRVVFGQGHTVDDAATSLASTRYSIIVTHLGPWLVKHGVACRGAKQALMDHPLGFVRQLVHAELTGGDIPTPLTAYNKAWRQHVTSVYTDPSLRWGDAAVPDDITTVARILATLASDQVNGLPVAELARHLDMDSKALRAMLVTPEDRSRVGGFTRPIYAMYPPGDKGRLILIPCPHRGCGGMCTQPVLLPEVAASGMGVICSTCRRVPLLSENWKRIVFPPEYLTTYTCVNPGSLRKVAKTGPLGQVVPLAVVHRASKGALPPPSAADQLPRRGPAGAVPTSSGSGPAPTG